MVNYTSDPPKDTITTLGEVLLTYEGLMRVHKHMRTLPPYPNKDAHYSIIERRINYCKYQIESLSNSLILGY